MVFLFSVLTISIWAFFNVKPSHTKINCDKVMKVFGYNVGYYYVSADRQEIKDAKSYQLAVFKIIRNYPYCFPADMVSQAEGLIGNADQVGVK